MNKKSVLITGALAGMMAATGCTANVTDDYNGVNRVNRNRPATTRNYNNGLGYNYDSYDLYTRDGYGYNYGFGNRTVAPRSGIGLDGIDGMNADGVNRYGLYGIDGRNVNRSARRYRVNPSGSRTTNNVSGNTAKARSAKNSTGTINRSANSGTGASSRTTANSGTSASSRSAANVNGQNKKSSTSNNVSGRTAGKRTGIDGFTTRNLTKVNELKNHSSADGSASTRRTAVDNTAADNALSAANKAAKAAQDAVKAANEATKAAKEITKAAKGSRQGQTAANKTTVTNGAVNSNTANRSAATGTQAYNTAGRTVTSSNAAGRTVTSNNAYGRTINNNNNTVTNNTANINRTGNITGSRRAAISSPARTINSSAASNGAGTPAVIRRPRGTVTSTGRVSRYHNTAASHVNDTIGTNDASRSTRNASPYSASTDSGMNGTTGNGTTGNRTLNNNVTRTSSSFNNSNTTGARAIAR